MIVIYHYQFFSDCFTRIFHSTTSFGLLFSDSGRDNSFKLAPLGSCVDVNIYTFKLSLKLPKASLTTFCGLGGAKTGASIGEELRISNAIRLMHILGLTTALGRSYWLLNFRILFGIRRNIRSSVTKTQTFLRLQCAALILSRSLHSKNNVTVF